MDSNSFSQFWQWVSQSFTRLSQNTARDVDELPPPPQEIKLVI
jgi:uncharacterized protein YegL